MSWQRQMPIAMVSANVDEVCMQTLVGPAGATGVLQHAQHGKRVTVHAT